MILNGCCAAFVLPIRVTAGLVAVQTLAIAVSRSLWDHGPTDLMPVAEAGVFAGFQIFAVLMIEIGLRERRARAELAALNLELSTAQTRLAESSRTAERLRIARDMRDAIGHELTALAVHLEVAAHLTTGQANQGLRLIAETDPDVALLDLRMPVLDGLATLQALPGPRPAVLVLTTFDDEDTVVDALRAGGPWIPPQGRDPGSVDRCNRHGRSRRRGHPARYHRHSPAARR